MMLDVKGAYVWREMSEINGELAEMVVEEMESYKRGR